jgi:hypothetical protein
VKFLSTEGRGASCKSLGISGLEIAFWELVGNAVVSVYTWIDVFYSYELLQWAKKSIVRASTDGFIWRSLLWCT